MTDFSELVDSSFKKLHKDMIDGLLESTALTVECKLHYRATKHTDCPNCIYDSIGRRSSNRYQSGGPIPFSHGMCPYCQGKGRFTSTETETLYLMPIWNSKDWYPLAQKEVSLADISVQTLSKMNTYPQLKRCSSIVIDTSVQDYGVPEFTRIGDPEICGLGVSSHIITSWKRS